jgi:uncharacterized RDD family membrane protein YckC
MDRKSIGSWLQGPSAALDNDDFGYPGQRLGLPQTGKGALARFGRRLVALTIDWFSAILLVSLFEPELASGSNEFQALTLAVFTGSTAILLGFSGATFGQRISGIGVVTINGSRATLPMCVLRQLLLILVIPVVIWDRDGRSLLDRGLKLMVVRTR